MATAAIWRAGISTGKGYDWIMLKLDSHQVLRRAAPLLLLALGGHAGAAPASQTPASASAQPAPPTAATAPAKPGTVKTGTVAPGAASVSTATPAAAPVAALMTAPQVIQLLDQTIDWYRTLGVQQQVANEPSDLLILYDNRQTANQVIALAFEIARANAEILGKQPGTNATADASTSPQTLSQLQAKFAAQGVTVRNELESDQSQLAKAKAAQKTQLKAKISELQGELELVNARQSLLTTMATFTNQRDSGGFSAAALKAQIDAMAVTVPSSSGTASSNAASGGAAPANTASTGSASSAPSGASSMPQALTGVSGIAAARFGVWDLASNVIRLSEKASVIDGIDQRTAALQSAFAKIRTPLVDQLKQLSARGDALAAQADTADSATLNRVRDQLDALSSQFKQSSAPLIPLSKEGVLLNQYRRNMGNWHDAIKNQYRNALKTLGVRLTVLATLLVIVFAAAEIWKRAVVRYIPDVRRRYQFLLLRTIAMWCLVIMIVGFAFASELGSLVTFAGLIAAGLAVAMQSVLVSIVGYFFLIGKYGIRIGDRVQIGDVTGEVIDLGLVRMHLMELGGHGSLGPTGRVVAFANSVVFQVSSGLFKQIHGVNLVWHDITLTLPAGIDYAATKEKLAAAVTDALKGDRDEIVRQTEEIQKATASSSGGDSQPRVQLSFTAAGVEAHIHYPVHLQEAAQIDERVSQAAYGVITALQPDSTPVSAT
jgi:small-conductance mechanosensitive channel